MQVPLRFTASRLVLILLAVSFLNTASAAAAEIRIQGRVIDQGGLALPGVSMRLVPLAAASILTGVTAGDGTYAFTVQPGDYRLEAGLDGFQTAVRDIRARESTTLADLVLKLASFTQETTVVATLATEIQPRQFGAPATVTEQVIENAPMRGNRYDDMLPLLPNVVRGPDGLVTVAGARAPQGVVLVNGVPSSDIASGTPLAPVPLGAVETVQVIATGFPAEHGPATGGVTLINSRPGSDTFRFAVNSFTPRPRLSDGGVNGIEAWNPNMSVRGPLARGRAWFAQSLDYHFEKTPAETVAGSQDRREHGLTSFTQIDAKPAAGHALTGWFNGQTQHVDAEGLGAFTPIGTVPAFDRTILGGAVIERAAFEASTLEARADVRHLDASLSPSGASAYLVGHDVTRGSYFDTVDRQALSWQLAAVFSRMSAGRLGSHLLKIGASAGLRHLDGLEQGSPVTFLRSNLQPAMRVDFVGPGVLSAESAQLGAFVQDGWDLSARVRLDAGFRVDHDTRAGTVAGPRAGLTWGLGDRTTVTAGGGWYAGDARLAMLTFADSQSRRVTLFDEAGVQIGVPTLYRNVVSDRLDLARAALWSGRVDHVISRGWQLRVAVQERRGTHEALVTPEVVSGTTVALLSSGGTSRARSIELTLGYHPATRRHQLYVSYVRSSSRGNTNDFGQVNDLFRTARLDAAEMAPLPADVPHRLLAWGLFSLPARVTVAPFFDLRSGFPYSAVRDDWSYAGPRFGQRFPAFASLDLVVNKIVSLPGGLRARVGVKLYNIAGRRNGRDVQADLSRPDFGQTYNALGRQVRGVFEIIWGGSRK